MDGLTDVEPCSHAGNQMCAKCSWTQPHQALVLVLRGRTTRTAFPVAVVVGTVLSAVNQGSVILGGDASAGTWIRVAVNYAVPFLVASIGYLSGRRIRAQPTPDAQGWQHYLAGFHDQRAAITERLLARADSSPYRWLAEPLQVASGPVLDLACGSAPTRPLLPQARWVGLDSSPGELAAARQAGRGPLLRARADALPLADHSVDAVCAAMCFPVLTPLDAALAELERVLRPGGMIAALVPARLGMAPSGLFGWMRVMRALGVRNQPWPNPEARDGLAKLLRARGIVIDSDERRVFSLDLSDPAGMALLIDGLYLPGVDAQRVTAAKRGLAAWARPGRRLPLPLRRVVAHVPAEETPSTP